MGQITVRFALAVVLAVLTSFAPPATAQDGPAAFPIDALNPGLADPPPDVDRSTPRAVIETLLYLAENGRWTDAAHLLDLGAIDPADQTRTGSELAAKLHKVIERKAVINWSALIDRPDGLDAEASDRGAVAGQPRKSILLWTLDLADRPASLRVNRVEPEDGDPVWVFSRQTVDNIGALHARYGPSRFERELPQTFRETSVLGLMLWEIIGLPVLILAAILLGIGINRLLRRLSARVDQPILSDILSAIRGPAVFGGVTALLSVVTSTLFVFSGRIDTVLTPLIWAGIVGSALWLLVNAVDAVLDRLVDFGDADLTERQEHQHRAIATRVAAGRRILLVIVFLVGAGIVLTSSNIFTNLGLSLIGTAGAVTLILGFAARRILGNILSSLQIALNQSAKIGDRVMFKDHLCHVERINFTFVQLRDWDGTRLVVPVEEFVSTAFENWTMQEPEMLRIIKIKTAHDADVDALRDAFDEIVGELDQDELGNLDDVKVRVAGQDVFGKDVWFALPCKDPNTSWDLACQAREKIMARGAEIERRDNVTIFPDANPAEAA